MLPCAWCVAWWSAAFQSHWLHGKVAALCTRPVDWRREDTLPCRALATCPHESHALCGKQTSCRISLKPHCRSLWGTTPPSTRGRAATFTGKRLWLRSSDRVSRWVWEQASHAAAPCKLPNPSPSQRLLPPHALPLSPPSSNPSNWMWRILRETGIAPPDRIRGAHDDRLMPAVAGVGG